ncbi:MAG: phage tail protein [Acetobacteraceae bacterium]
MAEPFVGQIIPVGFNFVPVGWLACNGQLVPISQYETLFMLIGTTYGGDGQTTFGLPDLRGRVPLGQGQGPGRSNYVIGQMAGTESVTLQSQQVGAHNHSVRASAQPGTTNVPGPTQALAVNSQTAANLYASPPATVTLAPGAIAPAGSSMPHQNLQPFQVINYIIAYNGIFPQQG